MTESTATTQALIPPRRIQRKRTKGWKMPAGAVYVGRPSKWGNPFHVIDVLDYYCGNEREAREDCVRSYREALLRDDRFYIDLHSAVDAKRQLRGKDLACWCPLDQPCHADVLLEIANG